MRRVGDTQYIETRACGQPYQRITKRKNKPKQINYTGIKWNKLQKMLVTVKGLVGGGVKNH